MTDERFDLITALHAVCCDYHSGQWSRGYRILSRIQTRYEPRNLPDLDKMFRLRHRGEWNEALRLYILLARKYGDKL